MSNNSDKISQIRKDIDKLDQTILSAINERAKLAQSIAKIKQETSNEPVYYRPEREAQILRNIVEKNPGPLANDVATKLFREIMSACLALQIPQKIAYLGPEGTFTQAAALKFFGQFVHTIDFSSIDEVFREVQSGAANYGVVPIENSTEGVVNHTLDSFLNSSLKICGEITIPIHHHLLSKSRSLKKIKRIVSHQQSFAQCREWLDHHIPKVERFAVASNAQAAQFAQKDESIAAIAGEVAATTYQLNRLASNIEDQPDNTTRFLVIANHYPAKSGQDKSSFLLSSPNKPGSLYALLEPFARNKLSLNRIESRPAPYRALWEYVFFIDIDGHIDNNNIKKVLAELEENGVIAKHLGSYPKAVI